MHRSHLFWYWHHSRLVAAVYEVMLRYSLYLKHHSKLTLRKADSVVDDISLTVHPLRSRVVVDVVAFRPFSAAGPHRAREGPRFQLALGKYNRGPNRNNRELEPNRNREFQFLFGFQFSGTKRLGSVLVPGLG